MNKRTFYILALLAILLLNGCSQAEAPSQATEETEPEVFQENLDLSYSKWNYNGWQWNESHIDTPYWIDENNLTSTAENAPKIYGSLVGWCLIQNNEEYNNMLYTIQQKEIACTNEIGIYAAPTETVNTLDTAIDETFFEHSHLAVVDFCASGSPWLRTRLDAVEIDHSVVTVTLLHEYLCATTSDAPGEVYWIPVPAECTEITVNFVDYHWRYEWEIS